MANFVDLSAIAGGSIWEKAAFVVAILLIAYILTLWIAAVMWAYRDIQSRSRDRSVQAICTGLVAVFNVPGMLLYLMLRPQESLSERFDRQLEVEAMMHEIQDKATCTACRRPVDEDFVSCPYCRTSLRMPCESCGKSLDRNWVLCPYCSAERAGRRDEPAAAAVASAAPPVAERPAAPERRPWRPTRAQPSQTLSTTAQRRS